MPKTSGQQPKSRSEIYKDITLKVGEDYGLSPALIHEIVEKFFNELIESTAKHGIVHIPGIARLKYRMVQTCLTDKPRPAINFKFTYPVKTKFMGLVSGDAPKKTSPVTARK